MIIDQQSCLQDSSSKSSLVITRIYIPVAASRKTSFSASLVMPFVANRRAHLLPFIEEIYAIFLIWGRLTCCFQFLHSTRIYDPSCHKQSSVETLATLMSISCEPALIRLPVIRQPGICLIIYSATSSKACPSHKCLWFL